MKKGKWIRTIEVREKISLALKGRKTWNKGKKMPISFVEKCRLKRTGYKLSEETKRKISKKQKLHWSKLSEEKRKEIAKIAYSKNIGKSSWNIGKPNTWSNGSKSNLWKGGISKINKTARQLFMETIEYKQWRKMVFERDNYTCQSCFERCGILHADHILPYQPYPELRLVISNGRTLCFNCHKKTKTYGNQFRNELGQFSTMELKRDYT